MGRMPANLTPEYQKAEQHLREASTDEEKLTALREMLSTIPKHKGTDKMQADIKRRISLLRKQAARKSASRGQDLFYVPRNGAGQVVLIGPPNTGKSSLVAATTNAPVKVGEYPYTTALPVPGMWSYQDVQIQLVDTPPLTAEHVPAGLFGTIRHADVIGLVVDAAGAALEQADATLAILAGRNIQAVTVPHAEPGDEQAEYPALIIANKTDLARPGDVELLRELYADRLEVLPVSATARLGLESLVARLWELLAVIRVYTKQPGRPPDNDKPYTLPVGSTIEDLAAEIHRDLPVTMKYARIWGQGRFDGQRVHKAEVLHDKDVVEIHQ